jgi:uncharacterized protein (DUF302 family)
MRKAMQWAAAAAVVVAVAMAGATAASADKATKTFTAKKSFEDAKFDLTNAITDKGLTIDATGHIAAMLARTGADVGSTKPIYKAAEYVTFCSAKLSRQMMEADAGNMGLCPYVMFVYETVAKPGEVTVGYRRLPDDGSDASKKAFKEINALLDGIAEAAAK